MADARLAQIFRESNGEGGEPDAEFLRNFATPVTGFNGAGPILNANAQLLPTRADDIRESAAFNDFRIGSGLGISRAFRKQDSMGGNTADGFYGFAHPNKQFGRDSRTPDLNYHRQEMLSRADVALKKMGFKGDEAPNEAHYQPWQWNDNQTTGRGGAPVHNPNQFNRVHSLPDADAVARRLYQPAPSRVTKMVQTDVEAAALRPNRTLHHPLKVVSSDLQRQKLQRVPRNADVIETITYADVMPRGMGSEHGTPKVWAESGVLRQPVGTNETGDRSVLGRWNNGYSDPLLAATNQDLLTMHENTNVQIRGHQPVGVEANSFMASQAYLDGQRVEDVARVAPTEAEFPELRQGLNGPLRMPAGVGRGI